MSEVGAAASAVGQQIEFFYVSSDREIDAQGAPAGTSWSRATNGGRNSTGLRGEPTGRGWAGEHEPWIIMYIAMMASMQTMGLAPSLVPVRTDEDRPPFGDI